MEAFQRRYKFSWCYWYTRKDGNTNKSCSWRCCNSCMVLWLGREDSAYWSWWRHDHLLPYESNKSLCWSNCCDRWCNWYRWHYWKITGYTYILVRLKILILLIAALYLDPTSRGRMNPYCFLDRWKFLPKIVKLELHMSF